jgi:hypothetical protein
MRPARQFITAGVLVAALGLAPRVASAQSSTTGSDQPQQTPPPAGTQPPSSQQPPSSEPPSTQPPSTTPPAAGGQTATPDQQATGQPSSASGVDEAKARQELAAARQALADLTKLPAATQLQGEQRTAITNFISAFNTFATASTDWKPKFKAVDEQLTAILEQAGAGGATGTSGAPGTTTPSTSDANASPGTTGSGGSTAPGAGSTGGGGWDPSIVAKLQEVRQHLDAFQLAIGDPDPHIKAIEKILADAGAGGSSAVGTTGSATSAGGGVTLTPAQVQEIQQHLEALRAAANQ